MEIVEKEGRLFVNGKGVKFLKLQSEIASRIGVSRVRGEGKGSFSISVEFAGEVRDLIFLEGSSLGKMPSLVVDFERHEIAKESATKFLESGEVPSISEHWDEILDPKQAVAVRAMITDGLLGMCLFDEQGSGKTVMSIAAFDTLKKSGSVDRLIIVCPKSMVGEWPGDFRKFLGEKYHIEVLSGDYKSKFDRITNRSDVYVTNFAGIGNIEIPLKNLAESGNTLLIVDESFYVKNPEAMRSENIRRLRRSCVKGFVLCGTPAPNGAADLVNQFDIADNGYAFRGYRPSGDIERDRDDIRHIVETRGFFLRRLKTSILPDLPEKYFHIVQVELQGRQAVLYEEARQSLVLWLRGMDNTAFRRNLGSYFAKRQALLQICACPSEVDPMFVGNHAKLISLDRLIDSIVNKKEGKVVVWSYYRSSLNEIATRYREWGLVRIDGAVSQFDRREAVSKFQNDSDTKIFLGNPAAAGAGITLHAASDAVYVSLSNQAAQYLQSLDRIHRRGQDAEEVNYHLLACKGTIEEAEIVRLRHKEIEQQDLLGDDTKFPASIDDAIAELSSTNQ